MFVISSERTVWWPVDGLVASKDDDKPLELLFKLPKREEFEQHREALRERPRTQLAAVERLLADKGERDAGLVVMQLHMLTAPDNTINAEYLLDHVRDWRNAVNEEGEEVPFSREAFAGLLAWDDFMIKVGTAFNAARLGGPRKN